MTSIGGYFELELQRREHYHKNAIKLNSARNCFEYILRAKQYAKVYIPYYICDVMLEPIKKMNLHYEFYHIDKNLEPINEINLKKNEAFLYTNYFGLQQSCVERLSRVYGPQLIIDNAQAFYAPRMNGIDTFYSPRKFFGIADGGYLYTDNLLDGSFEQDYSYNRMSHLLKRIDLSAEDGYNDFHENEDSLINQPIKRMSKLTDSILSSINYGNAKIARINNFHILDSSLKSYNRLNVNLNNNTVPMIYPFLTTDKILKQKLISKRIYVATYWQNVCKWTQESDWEHNLVNELIAIPIDQRHGENEMKFIIETIRS